MGANDQIFKYDTTDEDEVAKRFKADCPDSSGCDNAEGYCGCPCQFEGRISKWGGTFDDESAAEDWILDTHSKWDGAAVAAEFYVDGKGYTLVGGWAAS